MKKNESTKINKITADMNIQDVVSQYPRASEVFIDYGLHCVGCAISEYESIEQGARGHGMDDETIKNMMEELNLVVSKQAAYPLNKEGITVSPRAAKMIKSLIKESEKIINGLQIKAEKSEAGINYLLDLKEKPAKDEQTIDSNDIKVYIDADSLQLVKPSVVDFLKSQAGEGFKVIDLK